MSDVFKSADWARDALAKEAARRLPPPMVWVYEHTDETLAICMKPGRMVWMSIDLGYEMDMGRILESILTGESDGRV